MALKALCGRGRIDHPDTVARSSGSSASAHDLECAEALIAVVHPTRPEDGRPANPDLA